MFHQLTTRIMASFQGFTGNRMTEGNIKDAISDIRKALLDADVAYPVVKTLLTRVQKEAAGQLIHKQVSPHQAFIQIFYQALVDVLGKEAVPLNFHAQPPVILLLVGLQGAGKTSFAAKLAGWIQKTTGKKVGLVSTDIYRPAAMEQLTIQAGLVNAYCYPATPDKSPLSLAQAALQDAKNRGLDVLIVDTAGRLHVDDAMMIEVKGLHQYLHPTETLLVVDGMMGKDAVTSALAFHEALTLTGVLVSKLDGDARGGAVLSVKETIGAPVKFIGVGEKMDAIEIFHPERIASRILGMGDIKSLMEQMEQKISKADAERLAKKVQSGEGLNLEEFRNQLLQMQGIGLGSMMGMLPGMGAIAQKMGGEAVIQQTAEKKFGKMLAILNSMTLRERKYPHILNGSRKQRIALGSGTNLVAVNEMLREIEKLQKMMKKFGSKRGIAQMGQLMQQFSGPGGFSGPR